MFILNKRLLLGGVLVAIIFTTGCANRAESIAASLYMSHERYIDASCAVLATQMSDARASLAKFSEKQLKMCRACL